jgi:aspartate racemase
MKTIGLRGGMSWERTAGYYRELCMGRIVKGSRLALLRIIDDLALKGAEAVILGCTEIGLLVRQSDTRVKLYDTTLIHVEKVVEYASGES